MKKDVRHVDSPLFVKLNTLAGMLDVGLNNANQIGVEAGAKIKYGRTVLYSVKKVEEYLNSFLEEKAE